MNYIFQPCPTFGISEHPFATWQGTFNDEEIQKIVEYAQAQNAGDGRIGGDVCDPEYRRSQVSWISFNNDTAWIFDRLAWVTRNLNGQFYRFDLYGFCEPIQFTVYDESMEGHYEWHQDSGTGHKDAPRKLSVVVQLSDPSEYEGGELELMTSKEPTQVLKQKGLAAAFPSYILHRVTPVTKGTRRTLVIWTSGPAFR
jgi:PKHD-type hydroxylase